MSGNSNGSKSPGELYPPWPARTSIGLAAVILVLQLVPRYDPFEAAFGDRAAIFWICVVAWCAATVMALRRRHWLVLLAAPFVLYPVGMAGVVLAACLQGNCL